MTIIDQRLSGAGFFLALILILPTPAVAQETYPCFRCETCQDIAAINAGEALKNCKYFADFSGWKYYAVAMDSGGKSMTCEQLLLTPNAIVISHDGRWRLAPARWIKCIDTLPPLENVSSPVK